MLKLPPPVWALVYVLFAVAISWPFGWPKMPGFPLPPLGIALVTVPWILPVWAIIMFRREGTEVSPTSPANRKLITIGDPDGKFAIAQMPNDAAAEKAGSAEHGDGATVRCHHDSNSPVYIRASHCLDSRNPSGAIEQSSTMMKSFTGSVVVGRPPLTIDSLLVRP